MPNTPEVRRLLGALMEERRLELGLRWQDVAERGGVSLKALHSARTGNASIRPLTQRAIEDGLRWEHGSIQRVMGDGDPIRLPSVSGVELADAPEQDREPPADPDTESMINAIVIAAISPVERQVWDEVNRHPEGSAATVIFTDAFEQMLWEREHTPESERVREIAALRAVRMHPSARARRKSA